MWPVHQDRPLQGYSTHPIPPTDVMIYETSSPSSSDSSIHEVSIVSSTIILRNPDLPPSQSMTFHQLKTLQNTLLAPQTTVNSPSGTFHCMLSPACGPGIYNVAAVSHRTCSMSTGVRPTPIGRRPRTTLHPPEGQPCLDPPTPAERADPTTKGEHSLCCLVTPIPTPHSLENERQPS